MEVPKLVLTVHVHVLPSLVGHVVRQVSPVRQRAVVVNAVELAYGNADANVVEVATM